MRSFFYDIDLSVKRDKLQRRVAKYSLLIIAGAGATLASEGDCAFLRLNSGGSKQSSFRSSARGDDRTEANRKQAPVHF